MGMTGKHICQERDCPSFGHPSSTGCRCHKAPVVMLTEENTRLRKDRDRLIGELREAKEM